MNRLGDLDVLTIWERGATQHALDRALTSLTAATGATRDELADWSIGRRDAALCELHRTSFGRELRGIVRCSACDELVEVDVPLDQMRWSMPGADTIAVEHAGRTLHCRQPSSRDLALAARAPSQDAARRRLIAATITDSASADVDELEPALVARIEAALADMAPPAEILLAVACPACAHAWSAPLDIADLVWRAIDRRARHTMEMIARLAERYGWTEAECLALPAARRQYYLERVA